MNFAFFKMDKVELKESASIRLILGLSASYFPVLDDLLHFNGSFKIWTSTPDSHF